MQQNKHHEMGVRNFLVTISYDGKNYHGWQVQKNALTVQEVFQSALYKVIGEKVDIKGCSRTDSGVHANNYCLSFKTTSKISCNNFVFAINRYLPYDICAKDCKEVPMDFHARYSCKGKEYVYKIYNGRIRNPFLYGYALHYWYPIDVDKIRQAGELYIGKHDFTSFCTIDKRECVNIIRNVRKFQVKKEDLMLSLYFEADGFLYNMVRIMVGTLLKVCRSIEPYDIKKILLAKDRSKAGPTAPACGLYLDKIFYDI